MIGEWWRTVLNGGPSLRGHGGLDASVVEKYEVKFKPFGWNDEGKK